FDSPQRNSQRFPEPFCFQIAMNFILSTYRSLLMNNLKTRKVDKISTRNNKMHETGHVGISKPKNEISLLEAGFLATTMVVIWMAPMAFLMSQINGWRIRAKGEGLTK
ncbi:hypothetical protein HHI36_009217, partial [Cryptolaemus montrouzieri]